MNDPEKCTRIFGFRVQRSERETAEHSSSIEHSNRAGGLKSQGAREATLIANFDLSGYRGRIWRFARETDLSWMGAGGRIRGEREREREREREGG